MTRDAEAWEQWFAARLLDGPAYQWRVTDFGSLPSEIDKLTAVMAVGSAADEATLIELVAELTPRASLTKYQSFVRQAAAHSAVDEIRAQMLARAVDIIVRRDDGVAPEPSLRHLSREQAEAEKHAGNGLLVFLHALADPTGFEALGRFLVRPKPEIIEDDAAEKLRSKLYAALLEWTMFQKTLPPMPPGLLDDLR